MTEQDQNSGAKPEAETSLRDELTAQFSKASEPAEAPAEAPGEQQPEAPEGETDEQRAERERDERGRFKAKSEGEPGQEEPAKAEGEEPEEEGEKPRYGGPPPGWSVAAKAKFDELPDEVRSAIAKREEEIDRGFAKLKDYKGLEPYADMARQAGMGLPDLMERYHRAEQFLSSKPQDGILWLCQQYGVDPRQLAGQNPQQGTAQQSAEQKIDPAIAPVVQPLLQEINQLKQQLGRVDTLEKSIYTDKYNQVSNQVEQFFSDPSNKFSEDVADQMVVLINQAHAKGEPVDLEQIYETACFMHPEVRQALINERLTSDQKARAEKARQTADQARQAGASIAGGPPASPPPGTPDTDDLRTLLERGYAEQMGRI